MKYWLYALGALFLVSSLIVQVYKRQDTHQREINACKAEIEELRSRYRETEEKLKPKKLTLEVIK